MNNPTRKPAVKATGKTAKVKDYPFTAKLPDGRTLFLLIPAEDCEVDVSGELLLLPKAVRLVDRAQALAMRATPTMTPATSSRCGKPWG